MLRERSQTQKGTLKNFINIKLSKRQNNSNKRHISGCLGPEMGQEGPVFGVIEVFQNFIVMLVAQLCTFSQIHQAGHLKWLIFVVCQVYLKNFRNNKKDKREPWITQG